MLALFYCWYLELLLEDAKLIVIPFWWDVKNWRAPARFGQQPSFWNLSIHGMKEFNSKRCISHLGEGQQRLLVHVSLEYPKGSTERIQGHILQIYFDQKTIPPILDSEYINKIGITSTICRPSTTIP
jgi:hypothetical protein